MAFDINGILILVEEKVLTEPEDEIPDVVYNLLLQYAFIYIFDVTGIQLLRVDEVEQVPYNKLIYVDKDERKDLSEDDLVRGMYKNVDIDGRPIEEAWFDVPEFGSIDHASSGLLKRFLKDNNLSLEDYLVRKDVVVVITGDEYSTLSDMFECGLINKDSIVLQFPKKGSFDYFLYEESENEKTD